MSRKVLVVEDEVLIGMDLVMLLEDWGYRPDGPHASVETSLRAVETFAPEMAILDVNLGGGETSMPVAEALIKRGTPFIFLTGYTRLNASDDGLAGHVPKMKKPVSEDDLKAVLEKLSEQVGAAG